MRYAVISDIHGNMDALEAVLADARKQGAEGYLFAGDYCLSLPYPEEVIDRIRKIENAVLIRGNEEQYIERMRGEREECWAGGQMHISCWCEQALCEENKDFLQTLPKEAVFQGRDGGPNIFMEHSSQTYIGDAELGKFSCPTIPVMYKEEQLTHEKLLQDIRTHLSGSREFQERCGALEKGVYIFGHTHIQWFMKQDDRIFINPGSCGLPMDGCEEGAPYTLLISDENGLQVQERRVPYDIEAFIRKIEESDQFERVPVWSKIRIKELRSRREHLYFFLKYASEYAERTGDTVRPFGKKTWEGAFEEWDKQ